jgi:hypothetical protein
MAGRTNLQKNESHLLPRLEAAPSGSARVHVHVCAIPLIPTPIAMSTPNPFRAQWTKLIANAWSNPSFRAQFDANPAAILLSYGIQTVQGHDVSQLTGKIKVTAQAPNWTQKPSFANGELTIPFPTPAKSYS